MQKELERERERELPYMQIVPAHGAPPRSGVVPGSPKRFLNNPGRSTLHAASLGMPSLPHARLQGSASDFSTVSSSKLVLETVKSRFAVINYYENGSPQSLLFGVDASMYARMYVCLYVCVYWDHFYLLTRVYPHS
jgi:hypothetical protein